MKITNTFSVTSDGRLQHCVGINQIWRKCIKQPDKCHQKATFPMK